jgi:hypothetical protein
MGSRWSGVTHIVEDNSILNHVLDTTTSMKCRQLIGNAPSKTSIFVHIHNQEKFNNYRFKHVAIVSKDVGAKELNKKQIREMIGDDVFKVDFDL